MLKQIEAFHTQTLPQFRLANLSKSSLVKSFADLAQAVFQKKKRGSGTRVLLPTLIMALVNQMQLHQRNMPCRGRLSAY